MSEREIAALRADLSRVAGRAVPGGDPDYGVFSEPEVVWHLDKKHHIGLIVRSPSPARVDELLAKYVDVIRRDFHAAAPPQDRPTD